MHLSATFADQPDHSDIGRNVAREHGQQHRLADAGAGAGEDAHALAAAARNEGIEGANAEIERRPDPPPRVRERWRIAERIGRRTIEQRSLAIDRLAQRIDHASQPSNRRPHRARNRGNKCAAAPAHAFKWSEGHQQRERPGESDHFTRNILSWSLDNHSCANRHGMQRSGNFHISPRTPTTRP